MIELVNDRLVISFPEVGSEAEMTVDFQRTLRIPDDGREYPLPSGLGRFPLRHVDDYAAKVPREWIDRGGVMLPMYQSEALSLHFQCRSDYPFSVRVATGKIDAITGLVWHSKLQGDPQNYLVVPDQPWLDGYCAEKGVIRQFVAMPLGAGYTAEEQLTGQADVGGLQIIAHPMRREAWHQFQKSRGLEAWAKARERLGWLHTEWESARRAHELTLSRYFEANASFDNDEPPEWLTPAGLNEIRASYFRMDESWRRYMGALHNVIGNEELSAPYMFASSSYMTSGMLATGRSMGLAPGGRMHQAIYEDSFGFDSWDREHSARCFVHIANSQTWREITGERPPTKPISRKEYMRHQLPWFDYYTESGKALAGAKPLSQLKSVAGMARRKGGTPLADNQSIQVDKVMELRKTLRPGQVREGDF